MKIPYKHIVKCLKIKPSIEEISEKLFQLGHEHEIQNNIFDIEITPNRGDCLSLNGILRELSIFFEINLYEDIYDEELKDINFRFKNNKKKICSKISFLKLEINHLPKKYKGELNNYFEDLNLKKNNFFTDVSNYIAYETGQPTHCYDANSIDNEIIFDVIKDDYKFETLLDKKITLKGSNPVFLMNDEVINLAGVVGGKKTACSKNTTKVIIECAYFEPDSIIGKSVKYDVNSDAAYKFERNVDPNSHERCLNRFLKVVQNHAEILDVGIYSENSNNFVKKDILYDLDCINSILGTNIDDITYSSYLENLGFNVKDNLISIPSYRSDIQNQNDLSEEVARIIGYDNIDNKEITIVSNNHSFKFKEENLKSFLNDNGFFEVINYPFSSSNLDYSLKLDNPLDTNKTFLRTELKDSLIKNLLYNERRQKDSIKLFEISDVYTKGSKIKVLGLIASGRVGKNFPEFSKPINESYFKSLLSSIHQNESPKFESIDRTKINTKLKRPILYAEINLDNIDDLMEDYIPINDHSGNYVKYKAISDQPISTRDLSFSIKKEASLKKLHSYMNNYKSEILKDLFLFDFYNNNKTDEIKIGYRLVFQSINSTLTEKEIDAVYEDIIKNTLSIESLSIPGLNK